MYEEDSEEEPVETGEPVEDKLIETLSELVNNLKAKSKSGVGKAKKINRVSLMDTSDKTDLPKLNIPGLGTAICDSGAQISVINPKNVPENIVRQNLTTNLEGFDGV